MIKLPTGGSASITLDLSYFPRLNGLEGTEKLVEDFKDFIAPMLISPFIKSCHSQLTLIVHSSVPLPANQDGFTWKCQRFLMTLFPSQIENCSKYAKEEAHHHYVCKVSMESVSPVGVSVEALEKTRELDVHSNEYDKTTPKPDVLLAALVQDEEAPVMAQTPPQNVKPVLPPITIPSKVSIFFAPAQDKDEDITSPTIILPQDRDPFYYYD